MFTVLNSPFLDLFSYNLSPRCPGSPPAGSYGAMVRLSDMNEKCSASRPLNTGPRPLATFLMFPAAAVRTDAELSHDERTLLPQILVVRRSRVRHVHILDQLHVGPEPLPSRPRRKRSQFLQLCRTSNPRSLTPIEIHPQIHVPIYFLPQTRILNQATRVQEWLI